MPSDRRSRDRRAGRLGTFSWASCARFGGAMGVALATAVVCAGSTEQQAQAGPPDGGAVSPLVARAQRGEVVAPDLGDLEHMCALLTSCDKLPIPPSLIPPDFSACVAKM